MAPHQERRKNGRRDRVADWGFIGALVVGFQYATVESLTHAGWHFGDCATSHAHTFPWMTAMTIVVFAAPKTLGPQRVEAVLLALAERAKRITGVQKALPNDDSK